MRRIALGVQTRPGHVCAVLFGNVNAVLCGYAYAVLFIYASSAAVYANAMLFIYDSALLFGHVNVVFVSDNVMCVHVGTVLFDHAIVVPRIQATALNWIRTSNIQWAL